MTAPTYVQSDPIAASTVPAASVGISGVSWAAIFAGALAAAALSLVLFILGIGLGLSSISVWSNRGAEGDTVGWAAIAWLAFTQLASAGVGGYIAGRLRVRWQGVHTDEVYFRDTAHGFLSWAFATLVMAALMGSVAGSAITGTVKAAGSVAAGAATAAVGSAGAIGAAANANSDDSSNPMGYWIDSLFRQDAAAPAAAAPTDAAPAADASADAAAASAAPAPVASTPAATATPSRRANVDATREVTRIYAQAIQTGTLPPEDARHVANLISERTGMPVAQAQERVQRSFDQARQQVEQAKEKAKQAAETARKTAAHTALWLFVALLIGAFVGSFCATIGGRQRDAY
ncbi:hypothetical protein [Comamonas antarctica]|uniref:Transmembrane protein n=1 Tax=Comamonas antarctica TaxID=2743470 RepID=A0A6N1X4N6_9BURK|nr:hypothetical protein [Comamonas antarctica]QKV52740.1 hypothetical protein HUK68_07420 [Comamonas antarctica]